VKRVEKTMQKLEIKEDLFRIMIENRNASDNPVVEPVRSRLENFDNLIEYY